MHVCVNVVEFRVCGIRDVTSHSGSKTVHHDGMTNLSESKTVILKYDFQ